MKKNNFFLLGQKVISLAEKNNIMKAYTTLNDDFKQRLKNENRYQDEKEVGEKRPILESPSPTRTSESLETEEQRNADFNKRWQEAREKALLAKKKKR